MDLKTLLKKLKEDKTRIMINGLGSGEVRGLIAEVQDDYIVSSRAHSAPFDRVIAPRLL
ncbi:MAG: hypothetical protein OIN86_10135 [Candidatus Methanoperedens sp.]|nr:hypothetical protein [Candidatus Methanoperedens sp.]CAG0970697.1 hypothetical protein METP1_01223 [Methanosarcinales archaeon]